jgi:hypothetical protein
VLGCSESIGDGQEISCLPGIGCMMKQSSLADENSKDDDNDDHAAATQSNSDAADVRKTRKLGGTNKCGAKPGSKMNTQRDLNFWYELCNTFETSYSNKMTQKDFLDSDHSGALINNSQSNQQSFSRMLKWYRSGELKPSQKRQSIALPYQEIEEKLVKYIQLRQQR